MSALDVVIGCVLGVALVLAEVNARRWWLRRRARLRAMHDGVAFQVPTTGEWREMQLTCERCGADVVSGDAVYALDALRLVVDDDDPGPRRGFVHHRCVLPRERFALDQLVRHATRRKSDPRERS